MAAFTPLFHSVEPLPFTPRCNLSEPGRSAMGFAQISTNTGQGDPLRGLGGMEKDAQPGSHGNQGGDLWEGDRKVIWMRTAGLGARKGSNNYYRWLPCELNVPARCGNLRGD